MTYQRPTGRDRARQRRQRRSATIVAITGVLVVGGFAYAVGYVNGWVPGSAMPTVPASCRPTTPPPPPEAASLVNVYNASSDQGQAKDVANALKSRQFDVSVVSNDPYKEKIDGVGQIRFGPSGRAFAEKYVKPLEPGSDLVEDGRTDSSVDVVLGRSFSPISSLPPTSDTSVVPPGC